MIILLFPWIYLLLYIVIDVNPIGEKSVYQLYISAQNKIFNHSVSIRIE